MKPRHRSGHCASDATACLFNMHPARVPHFIDKGRWGWERAMRAFYRRRGYGLTRVRYSGRMRLSKRRWYLMYGDSAIDPTAAHMALYRGSELYYDPAGRRRAFKGKPLWLYVPRRLPELVSKRRRIKV